jgi:hypothetical protein
LDDDDLDDDDLDDDDLDDDDLDDDDIVSIRVPNQQSKHNIQEYMLSTVEPERSKSFFFQSLRTHARSVLHSEESHHHVACGIPVEYTESTIGDQKSFRLYG